MHILKLTPRVLYLNKKYNLYNNIIEYIFIFLFILFFNKNVTRCILYRNILKKNSKSI